MLRLNTSIAATPAGSQNPLGVAAGDNAGFPNGRRPRTTSSTCRSASPWVPCAS
jgi:hypothetical protein